MTLPLKQLTDQEIENHLSALPRMQMSARGDDLFFSKLNAHLLAAQTSDRRAHSYERAERAGFLSGFRRFSFSFGVGMLAVAGVFTAVSYQDTVTRGSVLYPWKQTAEHVEEQLAFTTEQKVGTELRFADRRLNEAANIVGDSPELAFLVTTARAASDVSASLTGARAVALRETLADMNNHVNKASKIVEEHTLDAQEAVNLLDTIADRADRQVARLNTLKHKTPTESKFAVSAAANSQESYVASLVVAREEIRSLINERGARTPVKLANFSGLIAANQITGSNGTNIDSNENARVAETRTILTALQGKMNGLNSNDRAIATARVLEAQRALDDGKTGTAFGLSIAITKQLARDKGVIGSVIDNPAQVLSTSTSQRIITTDTKLPAGTSLLPQQASGSATFRVESREQQNRGAQGSVLDLINQIPAETTRFSTGGNIQVPTPQAQVQMNAQSPTVISPSPYATATQVQSTPLNSSNTIQIQAPSPTTQNNVIMQPQIQIRTQTSPQTMIQTNQQSNLLPQQGGSLTTGTNMNGSATLFK